MCTWIIHTAAMSGSWLIRWAICSMSASARGERRSWVSECTTMNCWTEALAGKWAFMVS